MKTKKAGLLSTVVGLLAAAGFMTVSAGVAEADTFGTVYNLTYDGCTGGCGSPSSFGTVSVSSSAGVITIDADLISGDDFANTGNGDTFQFSLTGPVLGVGAFTLPAGWSFVTPANSLDGLGNFLYGLDCTVTSGVDCGTSDLEFTVSSSGSITSETGGHHGAMAFAVDICAGSPGCSLGTGPVAAPVPGPIVGAGLPGLVVACGGLLGLARRRRGEVV